MNYLQQRLQSRKCVISALTLRSAQLQTFKLEKVSDKYCDQEISKTLNSFEGFEFDFEGKRN